MIFFYCISELMWVGNINSKHISFLIQFKKERNFMLSDATFYDFVNTIYKFIKPFFDNKMSVFEEIQPFTSYMTNFVYPPTATGNSKYSP